MKYQDKIYGEFSIDEPVILDLINSQALQRLKEVNQYGASFYRFSHLTTTRFEHCLGVYYLLRKFKASLKEQIAGLIHDVPHTAFSHVMDFVFGGSAFHEEFYKYYLYNSDIPKILKKYKFDWHDFLDGHQFKLLERDLPNLCADRLDYFFRDMHLDKSLSLKEINKILNNLKVFKNNFVFKNKKIAKFAALKFRQGNDRLWGNPLQATLFYIFAEAIKIALFENIISFKDLFSTDEIVFRKLLRSKNKGILKRLKMVRDLKVKENRKNYDYFIKTKIRVIDPYLLKNNKLVRLSILDPAFHQENEKYLNKKQEGFCIKII